MAENKKTFIFYSDWINMIREMPDEEAGKLLKHILSYVNDEDPQTDSLLVKMAFGHMKPLLKADLEKWDNIREIRKVAGKKGGQANAKQTQANAKQVQAVNDNVNVNVNGNVTDNENRIKRVCLDFKENLAPFLEKYDREDLNDFYYFWTEKSPKDRKMKFEKQKSFDIGRRLVTWMKRKKEFAAEKKKDPRVNVSEHIERIKSGEVTLEKKHYDWINPKQIDA